MSESFDQKEKNKEKPNRGPGRSLLGPVILIAVGVFLLLSNMGILPPLNWQAALQLWPLLLVFIGLNIIVRHFPRPFGTWLSFLIGLLTVGVFGFVLLFADQSPLIETISGPSSTESTQSTVSYPADDVDSAEVKIDFDSHGASVIGLEDSNNLIEGDITYTGELDFQTEVEDGRAIVMLDTVAGDNSLFWLNPALWFDDNTSDRWEIGLSPTVPIELNLDLGSGSMDMDLEPLSLENIVVDGGSGSSSLTLPEGDYDMNYDVGSGSVSMTLPKSGGHGFLVDGGSGSLKIIVPASMELRLATEGGSGGMYLPTDRYEIVDREDDDEGIWQSAGYDIAQESNGNWVNLFVDIGSGSLTIVDQ